MNFVVADNLLHGWGRAPWNLNSVSDFSKSFKGHIEFVLECQNVPVSYFHRTQSYCPILWPCYVSENFVYDSMRLSCVSAKSKTKFPSSQQHAQIAKKLWFWTSPTINFSHRPSVQMSILCMLYLLCLLVLCLPIK